AHTSPRRRSLTSRATPARPSPSTVGPRRYLPPLWRHLPADLCSLCGPAEGDQRHHRLSYRPTRGPCCTGSAGRLCALGLELVPESPLSHMSDMADGPVGRSAARCVAPHALLPHGVY